MPRRRIKAFRCAAQRRRFPAGAERVRRNASDAKQQRRGNLYRDLDGCPRRNRAFAVCVLTRDNPHLSRLKNGLVEEPEGGRCALAGPRSRINRPQTAMSVQLPARQARPTRSPTRSPPWSRRASPRHTPGLPVRPRPFRGLGRPAPASRPARPAQVSQPSRSEIKPAASDACSRVTSATASCSLTMRRGCFCEGVGVRSGYKRL